MNWADKLGARTWLRNKIEADDPLRPAALLSMLAMVEKALAEAPAALRFDVETLESAAVR